MFSFEEALARDPAVQVSAGRVLRQALHSVPACLTSMIRFQNVPPAEGPARPGMAKQQFGPQHEILCQNHCCCGARRLQLSRGSFLA